MKEYFNGFSTQDLVDMRRNDEKRKEKVEMEKEIERLRSIIKEVREYITSYESIDTIQQNEHSENNKDLDEKTMIEMVRRYLIVHDKVLEILDKVDKDV